LIDDATPNELAEDRALSGDAQELAELLDRERPVPPASFRGHVARRLAAADPGYGPRPPHLRAVGTLVGIGII